MVPFITQRNREGELSLALGRAKERHLAVEEEILKCPGP